MAAKSHDSWTHVGDSAVACSAEEVYQEGFKCYEQVTEAVFSPSPSGLLLFLTPWKWTMRQEVQVTKGGCKGIVRGTSCADTTRSSNMQNEVRTQHDSATPLKIRVRISTESVHSMLAHGWL